LPIPEKQLRPAVILVADRTLSGRYRVLFEGILATMQTTDVPGAIMRTVLSPAIRTDAAGRASAAALGIRRLEASLLSDTPLTSADVVCTTPEALPKLLGPWVKAVAVSSSDPLGIGMSNTTTKSFSGGQLYTATWLDRMMTVIRRAKDKHHFAVVAGGAGAWQWAQNPDQAGRQGIDTVFEGFFEGDGPGLFTNILAGRTPPTHLVAEETCAARVRPIVGPSMMGVIELTRGCGNGCQFCTSAFRRMTDLPAETILADLATNVAGGQASVVSSSEDFFRYGSVNHRPNFAALAHLLTQMRRVKGLRFMQLDHANITSVLQLEDAQLREVRRLLTWEQPTDFMWVNMGVESANGRLVAANAAGKIRPFDPDNWAEMVVESADKMNRTGFFPVFSIILGLPGETPADVSATLALVKQLGQRRAVVFPVFHEPVLPDARAAGGAFGLGKMRADHLELFRTCYEINFRMIPPLFWDNQRAGGVSAARRLLVQLLGRVEVYKWRSAFARIGRRIASNV
jgi:radical SAM superfamily enzyme YgiQ (UPF0313 family)